MTNDTAVPDARCPDSENSKREWVGRMVLRDAISRGGLEIDAASLAFYPHKWINSAGLVGIEPVRRCPLVLSL
jgi:hypothetical protein